MRSMKNNLNCGMHFVDFAYLPSNFHQGANFAGEGRSNSPNLAT